MEPSAPVLEHFQRAVVPLDLEIVAKHAAERASDILEQLVACAHPR